MKHSILALVATAALTTGAFGHSKSETTTPANGATVAAVEVIEMRFDAPMRVTAIALTGPDGAVEVDRETGLDPVTAFRAAPAAELQAGAYTVEWRGLAEDGHVMQGSFSFTLED